MKMMNSNKNLNSGEIKGKVNSHSLGEIAEKIFEANSMLLFPHISIDGDALGSCVALCKALREKGKDAYILIEEELPSYLKFMDKGYCTFDSNIIKEPDLCICVDCGELKRFPNRSAKFLSGKFSVCIDHHKTSQPFTDYYYIAPEVAATGELIFQLLKSVDVEIDKEMGEAIFAAITTDTGNFQYSNTTRDTLITVVELFDIGIDNNAVSVELYENISIEKLAITNKVMETLELSENGKVAIAYVTQDMLKETGAVIDDTEGVVQTLRSINSVEIAAFLREIKPSVIKVGLRAKRYGDVAAIAQSFGGGGHTKASGCTINKELKEAIKLIKKEIYKNMSLF